MELYVEFCKTHPIISGMIQFAILGPTGEFLASKIKKVKFDYTFLQILLKAVGWAILAIMIKYAFTGFSGFIHELINHNMLSQGFEDGIIFAFSKSFFTNIMFGPILMITHRLFDNIIEKKANYTGLTGAMKTLFWFWIPAHTITFILPAYLQMGLAALWSLALGVILGMFINNNNK